MNPQEIFDKLVTDHPEILDHVIKLMSDLLYPSD